MRVFGTLVDTKVQRKTMVKLKKYLKENLLEICLAVFSFLFSSWLMFSTFGYKNGQMLIATKAWSDFASTIPLIRSFSLGFNFPPQYSLFPGEPIHYHFLFYLLVGVLEKIGIRIDYSLNILSTFGFFSLLIMIYMLAKKLFHSKFVGILSVILFLFNGSLSFLEFFKIHPLSASTLNDIILNKTFPSFGPYDGKIVSAFWNLNIYTNQRHLAGAFALSLLSIFLFLIPILKNQKVNFKISILLGIVLGFFFYFHLAVFLMTLIVLILLSLFFKELRTSGLIILMIAGIITLPQYLYLQSGTATFKPLFSPGYLASFNLTFFSFIKYWFYNLGLHSILIPIGFFLSSKNLKKIFIPFFLMFIIGNTIQFSPEMAANHKFFNYFMIIGSMFSAFALVSLWKRGLILKPVVIVLFFFLILSGIIDFFPVYSDNKMTLTDYPISPDIKWIKDNTPKNSVFLNSQYLYDPASLAGRKIFLGWPYFSWSAGYDTLTRDNLRKSLLNSTSLDLFCTEVLKNKINYVELNKDNTEFPINYSFFEKNFKIEYKNDKDLYKIYGIQNKCR